MFNILNQKAHLGGPEVGEEEEELGVALVARVRKLLHRFIEVKAEERGPLEGGRKTETQYHDGLRFWDSKQLPCISYR